MFMQVYLLISLRFASCSINVVNDYLSSLVFKIKVLNSPEFLWYQISMYTQCYSKAMLLQLYL